MVIKNFSYTVYNKTIEFNRLRKSTFDFRVMSVQKKRESLYYVIYTHYSRVKGIVKVELSRRSLSPPEVEGTSTVVGKGKTERKGSVVKEEEGEDV